MLDRKNKVVGVLDIQKNLIVIFVLTLLIGLSGHAYAAYPILGTVFNASDATPADGHTAILHINGTPADNVTDVVGPTGGSVTPNTYLIDCELLATPCQVGDVLVVQVVNNGDDYVAGPVIVTHTGIGFESAPDMTLAPFCPLTEATLTVSTDKPTYHPEDTVTISGNYEDAACNPVSGAEVAVEIKAFNPPFPDQMNTTENGTYSTMTTVPLGTPDGTYTVFASTNPNARTTFEVCADCDSDSFDYTNDCDDFNNLTNPNIIETYYDGIDNDCDAGTLDWDQDSDGFNTTDPLYNGTDCNDNDVNVNPGAAEVCGDGIDNNCDGVDDACPAPATAPTGDAGGGGGGGGSGGGATVSCNPDWTCTEWSLCANGEQSRTCTDNNDCGTNRDKPDETQPCTVVCGDGTIEGDEECDGNSRVCDANGYAGTQSCSTDCTFEACEASESCGDNVCNGPETSDSCPQDCQVTETPAGGEAAAADGAGITGFFTGATAGITTAVVVIIVLAAIYVAWRMSQSSRTVSTGKGRRRKHSYDFTRSNTFRKK